jgi:hypothetical protein
MSHKKGPVDMRSLAPMAGVQAVKSKQVSQEILKQGLDLRVFGKIDL